MAYVPSRYCRYIEPFAGSASLFFASNPKESILSDTNQALIEMYRTLMQHPLILARQVYSYPNDAATYYHLRDSEVENGHTLDKAARFIYLNRHCFNGVYRTNKKGRFNVPRGTRTGAVPSSQVFFRCSYLLRRATLMSLDFEQCLSSAKAGDFVYLDPPYSSQTRTCYGEYGYNCFSPADHGRLIECLHRLDRIGAMFLLSYSDRSDLVTSLNPTWYCSRLSVRRHVAGFASHRDFGSEILVSNFHK